LHSPLRFLYLIDNEAFDEIALCKNAQGDFIKHLIINKIKKTQ